MATSNGATAAPPAPTAQGSLLRVATAGSVDDGKSTLIGRLLHDTKQILEDQLTHVEEASRRRGDGYVDLALLTDGLRAEREQGITIDVAYRYFTTPRRRLILADTPGHPAYTRNMVTGASTADVSLVLIDARNGVLEQSKRHAFLSSLVGVPHMVVCVNKMDLVEFDESVFEAIRDEFEEFAAKLDLPDMTFIPMSALDGDNVVDRSKRMPWYQGPPLLYHLEHLHVASDRNLIDARFPVQWVIRPMSGDHHDYRAYAGRVASGTLRPGDEVVVLPSGERSSIAAIDSFDGPLEEATPPLSVALRLGDDVDVSRGDMIVRAGNQPAAVRDFEAMVCWMSEEPLRPGARLAVKHTTRWADATVEAIRYRVNVETLHREPGVGELGLNDIGRLHIRTSRPLQVDDYRRNRETGSLILVDESTNETLAAGMIEDVHAGDEAGTATGRSPNVTWDTGALTRERRWSSLGTRGATLWMTGLPASGKSTIAAMVEERLVSAGISAYRLDGDNLRHGLNGNLGFSAEDRAENVRRAAHAARLLADAGSVAIVSLVSPYAADRELARKIHEAHGLPFVEAWMSTPLEECERRDPKGLYARARSGELKGMTGVDDPYERPATPDLVLSTAAESAEESAERLLALIDLRRSLG